MKLCKDCLYYDRFWLNKELSLCKSPNIKEPVSYIDGSITLSCRTARKDWKYTTPTCGSEAKWFKPKTPKLRFLKYFLTDK